MDEFNIDKWEPDKPWINFRNILTGIVLFITLTILYFTCA